MKTQNVKYIKQKNKQTKKQNKTKQIEVDLDHESTLVAHHTGDSRCLVSCLDIANVWLQILGAKSNQSHVPQVHRCNLAIPCPIVHLTTNGQKRSAFISTLIKTDTETKKKIPELLTKID
jgi:replication-associated recombination protein RarA